MRQYELPKQTEAFINFSDPTSPARSAAAKYEAMHLLRQRLAFQSAPLRVKIYAAGSLVEIPAVVLASLAGPEKRRGDRKEIKGFTARSRRAMQVSCAKLTCTQLPLFVTLTYPAIWDPNPRSWKRDLDVIVKKLRRQFPKLSAIWKLEPQKRGAPHFHLMIWGTDWIPHWKLALDWWDTCGRISMDHRKAGTEVQRARSFRGVLSYASKRYMGKEFAMPDGWEGVGRLWGIVGRKELPVCPPEEIQLSWPQAVRLQRFVRRWAGRDARWARTRARTFLMTSSPKEFRRLAEWCARDWL